MQLKDIKGVGKVTLDKLALLDIFTVSDLLNFLPKTYIDLSAPVPLAEVEDGQFCLLKLKIIKVSSNVRTKNRLNFFKAEAECVISAVDSVKNRNNIITLTWFNQPYMREKLIVEQIYFILGKIKLNGSKWEMANPVFEPADNVKNLKGVVPVYRTRGILRQNALKSFVGEALKSQRKFSIIDDSILNEFNMEEINSAILKAHNPASVEEGLGAQKRLATENAVEMLLSYRLLVKDTQKHRLFIYTDKNAVNKFINNLNFEFTESQKFALEEILSDLNGNFNMNRILAGDVGSGKTVLAFASMYYAVTSGYQAALMAPTEILAKQHYQNALKFFDGLNVKTVFLSASVTGAERREILAEIASGKIDIVIGTHSLIQEAVQYKKLSLAVIDEQHKFGVNQKSMLEQKAAEIDTLTLSATPIPRAILLILYEDLHISTIYKRKTASNITTSLVSDEKLPDMLKYIFDEALKGSQCFIVCPRIFDLEGLDIYSAEQVYDKLKNSFKGVEVGLLHGKQSADKKDKIMEDFASGKIKILIATTVVEVGIDVPNATIMAVLNADRFGLATLHQLRGRIGRGDKSGYCFLHTASNLQNARLQILKSNDDGFKISELDFDLRGGGDFLGTRQCGDTDNSGYAIKVNYEIIKKAKAVTDKIIEDGRYLENINRIDLNKYYNMLKDISIN